MPQLLVIVVGKVVDLAAQFEDLKLPSPLHILLQRRVDGFLVGAVPAGALRRVDKFASISTRVVTNSFSHSEECS